MALSSRQRLPYDTNLLAPAPGRPRLPITDQVVQDILFAQPRGQLPAAELAELFGAESDLTGNRRPGSGVAAESASSKRKPQQGKIFKKRDAASQVRVGCPLDANACRKMKEKQRK